MMDKDEQMMREALREAEAARSAGEVPIGAVVTCKGRIIARAHNLTEWFAYMSHYPKNWINAFDADGVIRSDTIYCLRAIPSLYLLDAEKRVICKDAPLEEVLRRLEQ